MSLIRPTTRQILHFNRGHLTDAGREHPLGRAMAEFFDFADRLAERRANGELVIAGGASFSDYLEKKVLDHIDGKTEFAKPANVYLALCTVVPEDSKTGVNITEAGYEGYARLKVEGAKWAAATGTSAAAKNNAKLEFAACTGSSATIIGWALTDNATKSEGNMLCWGTCTSTVISTTQTPATVAENGLEVTLD